MREQLVPVSLTREELEKTLGVFFIGYVISSVIYGFNFFQTWRYSSRYSSDPVVLKVFVALVCLVDFATVTLVSHALYIYLIELFPKTIGLVNFTTTLSAEILLAVISVFLVQSYYAHRLWSVHRKISIAMVLEIIALSALALGIARIADVFRHREFQLLGLLPVRLQIALRHGLVFVAGLILAIIQWCFPVQGSSSSVSGEKRDWFDKLVLYMITRFGIANAVQLGYLIVFVTLPRSAFWLPFQLCAQKLYVNAFLNELNSRPVKRGRGPNGSDNTFPGRSFVNPALGSVYTDTENREDNKSGVHISEGTENPTLHQGDRNTNKLDIPLPGAEDDISSCSWDPSRAAVWCFLEPVGRTAEYLQKQEERC